MSGACRTAEDHSGGEARTTRGVALVGALDTKAAEYGYVRERLGRAGIGSVLVDTGVLGAPGRRPDVDRTAVATAAGSSIDELVRRGDRSGAVAVMAAGAGRVVTALVAADEVHAVVVLGGSNAGVVMRGLADALPTGFPKVLVSTVVVGDTRPYIGDADVLMMNPVVDLAGLTTMSVPVLARAADALSGIVLGRPSAPPVPSGGAVGCTMFGVTTQAVGRIGDALAASDTETHVLHANGAGGRTFERLVTEGRFDAVVDLTTTELADELVGGVCSAGHDRLTAAARSGVPQVVGPGALDMVNFGPVDTVPDRFRGRRFMRHNDAVTLMRTSVSENAELGRRVAARLGAAIGPTEVVVPLRGFSQVSAPGGPFSDPEADAALIDALREGLPDRIPLTLVDASVNDEPYAAAVLQALRRVRPADHRTSNERTSA